eukprot:5989360-Pyramimonas_sp.AAC.1
MTPQGPARAGPSGQQLRRLHTPGLVWCVGRPPAARVGAARGGRARADSARRSSQAVPRPSANRTLRRRAV